MIFYEEPSPATWRLFYIYNMKKLSLLLFATLLVVVNARGQVQQTDSLAFDENNKYIYYQVVDQPGLAADTLYQRAVYFLKEAYPATQLKLKKQDNKKGVLTGAGGIMVSRKALVSKHDDGRISYNVTIEVKDGKYRYWLTDFVLTPYARDRYTNYVPVSGKDVPLEHALRQIGQKDLDDYLAQILAKSRTIGNKLKDYMTGAVKPANAEKAKKKETKPLPVIKKDW